MRTTLVMWLVVAIGCGPEAGPTDAGGRRDGATGRDAGTPRACFECGGGCIDTALVCDGSPNCEDGSDEADCGCTGCSTAAGACEPGTSTTACGSSGRLCAACGPGEACADGACEPLPGCDPAACTGCCRGDECLEGTTDDACGSNGAACETCSGAASCEGAAGARACEAPCGPDTCSGCCDLDGRCVEATDAARCGAAGSACVACDEGESCSARGCVSDACAATCDGCCTPDGQCDDLRHGIGEGCGWGGEACVTCAPSENCTVGGCVPNAECDGCFQDGVCRPGTVDEECGAHGSACHDCRTVGLECIDAVGSPTGARCGVDPSLRFDVYVVSADVPEGGDWDAFGGLPDPYVCIGRRLPSPDPELYEFEAAYTPVIADTLRPVWGRHLIFENVSAEQITDLELTLYDEDVLDRDLITACFIHLDELSPRLTERLLLHGELYSCPNPYAEPGEVIRIQIEQR